jgi:hypothetical protein
VSGYRLGIDYGTSNTVAVVRWPDGRCRSLLFDGSPLLPSAVFSQPGGGLATGRDAVHSARLDPTRFEPNPKRRIDDGTLLLGDRAVPLVDAVAAALRRVASEATRACGALPATIALTYPAGWGAVRRGVLVEAAERAGLPAPTLVPEPVAAAGYFTAVLGHAVRPGHLVVVYDLGAGTFDVSAVRRTGDGFEVCDVDGLADFGGLDLDALVVARVASAVQSAEPAAWRRLSDPATPSDQRHFRTLWDDARATKEMLSRQPSAGLNVPLVDRDVLVSREEFEDGAGPYLDRAAALTAQVMRRAGASAGNLAGVFLVGGASRVPLAATSVHRATGVAPTVLEQPEIVVAEGALHAVHPPPSGVDASTPWAAPPTPGTAMPAPVAAPAMAGTAGGAQPVVGPPPGVAGPATSPTVAVPGWVWGALAVVLLLIPLLFGNGLTALVCGTGSAFLLRHAVTWRPGAGSGFIRPRVGLGRSGTALTALGASCVAVGLSSLAYAAKDPDARAGVVPIGIAVTGIGLAMTLGGLALLVRARRPFPRLVVHAHGIAYQPDKQHEYQMPWAELARVDVAPPQPGQPPALVAVPRPDSPLRHDPRYAHLWRPDIDALAIADLPQLTRNLNDDIDRLSEAIARHRPAVT